MIASEHTSPTAANHVEHVRRDEEDDPMTTADNITDEQIANLMDEAISAGDDKMVEFCEMALGAGSLEATIASTAERRKARAICADAIADAEAQS